MLDHVHTAPTPRVASWMTALHLKAGNISDAEMNLLELIAWLAFDKPKEPMIEDDARTRILVVDDYPDTADVECTRLAHLGYSTKAAYSGREALDVDTSFCPDIVLLDVTLPDMCGFDVAKVLRKREHAPCVIAISGYYSPKRIERSKEVGCAHYLLKPVSMEELCAALPQVFR
jgi:CheY-like chemotaxis protein